MHDLVSLGEVMLNAPRYERLRQATRLDVYVAGSQLNVAANLAQLGKRTAFVSKLPANELGQLARGACQGMASMSPTCDSSRARMGAQLPRVRRHAAGRGGGLRPRRRRRQHDRGR